MTRNEYDEVYGIRTGEDVARRADGGASVPFMRVQAGRQLIMSGIPTSSFDTQQHSVLRFEYADAYLQHSHSKEKHMHERNGIPTRSAEGSVE